MNEFQFSPKSLEEYLILAIAALTVAIVALWRKSIQDHRRCIQDKDELWQYILNQNKKVVMLNVGLE